MTDNGYPAGTANDPRAPWNAPDLEDGHCQECDSTFEVEGREWLCWARGPQNGPLCWDCRRKMGLEG